MAERTCSVEGCEKRHLGHGFCSAHLRRWQRHGDPLAGRANNKQGTAVERFWAKVNKDGPIPDYAPHLGPCWIWTGYLTDLGYGGRALGVSAHVAAYTEIVGPVPKGLELDHLCRVPACCNPRREHAALPQTSLSTRSRLRGQSLRLTAGPTTVSSLREIA